MSDPDIMTQLKDSIEAGQELGEQRDQWQHDTRFLLLKEQREEYRVLYAQKCRILQKFGMAVEKAEKTPTTLAELTRELKRILDQ